MTLKAEYQHKSIKEMKQYYNKETEFYGDIESN